MSADREPDLFAPSVRVTIEVRRADNCRNVANRIVTLNEVESAAVGTRRAILAEAEACVDKLLKAGLL